MGQFNLLQSVLNIIRQPRIGQLAGGQIDRYVHRLPRAIVHLPLAQLQASLHDQPVSDGNQNACVLGGFNEAVRRNQALRGMIPARASDRRDGLLDEDVSTSSAVEYPRIRL